jgi:4-phospho-D-threonate 3-dehydrogenase / 4-phospho-D-erythronate 3-dehydrogenase
MARVGDGKPLIAITMGDPAGVGPEVVVAAAATSQVRTAAELLIVGDKQTLELGSRTMHVTMPAVEIDDLGLRTDHLFGAGRVVAEAGHASFEYVRRAIDLALAGEVDAIVTAPIAKLAWHAAGHRYPGHTEYIAERAGVRDFAMMLCTGNVRSALVTGHMSLRDAIEAISPELVYRTIRLADSAVASLVNGRPRIGVAGLNPHAGEGGLMGSDEAERIVPAVERAAREGLLVTGPWPADSLFRRAAEGHFDVVVAMYHDQGLIPTKTLGYGVNITLGAPIVRTSPDHGTAFDIAGKGVARATSTVEAVLVAARLALGRHGRAEVIPRSRPPRS